MNIIFLYILLPINKIIKEWINKEAEINKEIIEKFNIVRKSKDVNAKKQWVKDFFDILKLVKFSKIF